MTDPRIQKLADTLVNYSAEVKPGQLIYITSHLIAMPLAEAVYEEVIKAGGHPHIEFNSEELSEIAIRHSNDAQLSWISPADRLLYEKMDAMIAIRSSGNTRALNNADTTKQSKSLAARRELLEIRRQRTARNEMTWILTQFPTAAYAQEADMSLRDYEDFVYSATFSDKEDPVTEWRKFHTMQAKLIDWLKGKKQFVVKGPNIDMTVSVANRIFMNSSGKFNMPDGEIFTGPIEDSAQGWVKFTYPAVRDGREVEGVEFEFKDGKVVSAKAKKNQEFLLSQLDSDAGSRYLGEFAIGTNYGIQQFTKSILFDEKIGGTLHMAVGSSYPETGGLNKSVVHWDFICDMRTDSEIHVDGELFYKNGQFTVL